MGTGYDPVTFRSIAVARGMSASRKTVNSCFLLSTWAAKPQRRITYLAQELLCLCFVVTCDHGSCLVWA